MKIGTFTLLQPWQDSRLSKALNLNAMPFAKFPIGAVVRVKKTNEFALIVGYNLLMNKPETFLNYYVEIEGRGPAVWAAYDGDIELECLPIHDECSTYTSTKIQEGQ